GTLKPKKDKGVRIRIDSLLLRWRISEPKEKEVVDEFNVNNEEAVFEEENCLATNGMAG
ncbi:hypothetical protein Tco_0643145, partial [Tanacetum coccineum]